ncbi:hypothetical protein GBAR_LOCUS22551 [Geodia barretti]|uniref:Uncharacterized protein n=1 Tax=Geodia barretti TaxID=519541 RepID=A0AA35T502_GEOBA|nr:hypothetical protein GBAR_LOCUS22551 [Geodia barretti]
MEREANLLRCAKLSCYAEFNRMVHTIARSAEGPSFQNNSYRMTNGSSAEHLFYTTLTSMLNQIVQNSDAVSQKTELQQVYHWFCANKPLIATKTKTKQQRPKLSISWRPPAATERPSTAPSAFLPSSPFVELPSRPFTTDHTSSTQPIHGFTSQYMKQSLGLQLHSPPHSSRRATPDKAARMESSSSRHRQKRGGGCQPLHVSVVEISTENPDGHQSSVIKPSTLLELAPVVAAKMELRRELTVTEEPATPHPLSSPHPPTLVLGVQQLHCHRPPVHVTELHLPPTLSTTSRYTYTYN